MTEKELNTKVEYAFSHEFNHTLHAYIDITDDLVSATLLSQILYWFTPTNDGKSKVRICKDGFFWIAKKRSDWYREIRISEKQCDRAIKILTELKFIETKRYKFDGSPTTHIRPLYDNINKALEIWKNNKAEEILQSENESYGGSLNLPFGGFPNEQNVKIQTNESGISLTENTAEPTPKQEKKESKQNSFDEIISEYVSKFGSPIREEITGLLKEWLKVRKVKRAAMTDRAIQLNINKLDKVANESNMSIPEYLEEVICRGWGSFFEITNFKKSTQATNQQNNNRNKIKTEEDYKRGLEEGEDYF